MRRFVTAGQDGDLWLVVVEQGGIAHFAQASLFFGGRLRDRWMLSRRPDTLKDVVRAISALGPEPAPK
jgi:hypothetical protein